MKGRKKIEKKKEGRQRETGRKRGKGREKKPTTYCTEPGFMDGGPSFPSLTGLKP